MLDDRDSPPSPERNSVWSQIAGELTNDILSGAHAPDTRLPTEHMLAARFGVNRHTVRRALAELAAQGLVRVVRGSGTYVEEFAVDLVLGRRTRHSLSLRLAGMPGGLRVLGVTRQRAPAEVARALGLAPRSRVLRLQTLGEAKDRPLHVSERFFPLPRFDGLDTWVQSTGSITQAFAALGVPDYIRRESRITAVMPPSEVATLLAQPGSRPTLRVQSVNQDTEGTAIECATTYFAGDRVALLMHADD